MATLSPATSPKIVKRKGSVRRPRNVDALETHNAGVNGIRNFLKGHTCYEAFPVSFRLIVLDTELNVKKALQCLLLNGAFSSHILYDSIYQLVLSGVVSAPLWNSSQSRFAGMLTVLDIIHLIQYYYRTTASYEYATTDVETFRLESLRGESANAIPQYNAQSHSLREIEKELGVATPPLLSDHPSSSLYDACKVLMQTHARRLPLLDYDTETGHEVIVSVLTQYRMLKFIAINCHKEISQLNQPLRKLRIGTYVASAPNEPKDGPNPYYPIATATLDTSVFNVVHMFSERAISAVPIIDDDGVVLNLYETVDVITLVKLGAYQSLDLKIRDALTQRSPDFPGVVVCTAGDSLGTLLQLIKIRRVHRLVVVEGEEEEKQGGKKGRLLGIITLSDVLRYLIGDVDIPEVQEPPES
ncbi:nuclear protein SNF4 [Coprinopsis cinerea okayama7|uniref:Nuclear protein SNF4 n=1 Tax=Coprinopsis cinerea (strain Okayama-7 / 130 / ATCC MYA-4618 / FGSC 9003) TaxID=240176 RepID=A8N1I6_COPC7|nr:nuclear protein SNF4 [Coprinopsis cinerea okayama7\|eukprot:XP_001828766.2 nuclear protein SNF4 [Coprinopsis cinerea okayama7\